jgi:hypothetical protein
MERVKFLQRQRGEKNPSLIPLYERETPIPEKQGV